MADLLKLSKQYHLVIRDRMKKSGLSPGQLSIHERILELAETASDVNDLEDKKNAENLTFLLNRALSVDNWKVKAMAVKEIHDHVAVEVFEKTAEAAGKTTDQQSLSATVEEESTKGQEKLVEQEEIKMAFIGAVYALFDYRFTHGANIEQRKKLSADLKIHLDKLSSKDKKFEELVKQPLYKNLIPFSEAQWKQVLDIFDEAQKPTTDPEAQKELEEEFKEVQAELKGKGGELSKIQKDIEVRGTRMLYLALAPADEPGEYTFEKIWEGGRDE